MNLSPSLRSYASINEGNHQFIYQATLQVMLVDLRPADDVGIRKARRFFHEGEVFAIGPELLSNVVYGVGQAAFLSDSSSTWTPSLNFTLFTTNVSSTNPLSRFHFFCAASSSL